MLLRALPPFVLGLLLIIVFAVQMAALPRVALSCRVARDAVLALPGLLIAAFAPGDFGPMYLGLALALWVEYFRMVRTMSGAVLAGPQVQAARLLGFGPLYIVRRHQVPELLPMVAALGYWRPRAGRCCW